MAVTKCREANHISWYKTIVLSLQQLYEQIAEEQEGTIDHMSTEWAGLRVCMLFCCCITAACITPTLPQDLARRYSLTLGLDWGKVRQPVVGIHR